MSQTHDKLETILVHGDNGPRLEGAIVPPIFSSATFESSLDPGADYHAIKYLRLNNTPNHVSLHKKLALLERAENAVVAASGMAAITTTMLALLQAGDHILAQNVLYGGTYSFIAHDLRRYGISHDFFDPNLDQEQLARLVRPNTKLMWTEAATNPLLQVADHDALIAFARKNSLYSVIDGTLLSPALFQPVSHGYDLVVHSATKYLNGHSDIVCGVVAGRRELVARVKKTLDHLGGCLDTHACFLLNRGLQTLTLRVAAQGRSALLLATNLQAHPAVRTVNYPGLKGSKSYLLAQKYFPRGCAGLLSFEVHGRSDQDAGQKAIRVLKALRLAAIAPSLGGPETLVTIPAVSSHAGLTPTERARAGISAGLIRVSVGLEHADDIWADFKTALDGVTSKL